MISSIIDYSLSLNLITHISVVDVLADIADSNDVSAAEEIERVIELSALVVLEMAGTDNWM